MVVETNLSNSNSMYLAASIRSGLLGRLMALLVGLLLFQAVPGHAQTQAFVISDIRVEGLQRISAGSVFAALPVGVEHTAGRDAL